MRRVVILVDDETMILIAMMRVLRGITKDLDGDFTIATFQDSIAASEAIPHMTDVFALITDCNMPGMLGTELARRVHQHAPVILHSALIDERQEEEVAALIADGVLSYLLEKPADHQAISQALLKVYVARENRSRPPTLEQQEEGTQETTPTPKSDEE